MSSRPARVASSLSDEEILVGLRRGDDTAFDAAFLSYYDRLVDCALQYVHSTARAEEVVQDVFCRLWERRDQWAIRTTLRGYLYAMVRNGALNAIRHQRVVERHEVTGLSEAATREADARVLERDLAVALGKTIDAMPPRTRQAFRLRTDHDLTYAEIAEAMGLSVKSVEKLLARAYVRLRETLHAYR